VSTAHPTGPRRSFLDLAEEMVTRTFPDADPAWAARQVSTIVAEVEQAVRLTTHPVTQPSAETVDDGNVPAPPSSSAATLPEHAAEVLSEAEHLFDRQRLLGRPPDGLTGGRSLQDLGELLARARAVLEDRPATALVLGYEVLTELDKVQVARSAATDKD
jgi:hypothetical protein